MATVKVHFGTNRNRTRDEELFGTDFADRDAPGRYVPGRITMHKINPGVDFGWVWDPNSLELDAAIGSIPKSATAKKPKKTTAAGDSSSTGAGRFASETMTRAALATTTAKVGGALAIFHIHGFASSFRDSMARAAQIADNYGASSIYTFSWPANGRVTIPDYRDDRDAAERTGTALADAMTRFLSTLRESDAAGQGAFALVAHSMGAYALRHAVQVIDRAQPNLLSQQVFRNAFLMAADEDDDALGARGKLRRLYDLAETVQVYRCGGDLALFASKTFLNGVERLGLVGPRDWSQLPGGRTVSVDCTDVGATSNERGETHFGHQYYRIRPEVLRDVRAVIAGTPPQKIPGRFPAMAPRPGETEFYIGFGA